MDGTTPVNLRAKRLSFGIGDTGRKDAHKDPIAKTNTTMAFRIREKLLLLRAICFKRSDGKPVESTESNIVEVSPVDTFKPSAPAAITLAASPTSISIFFPTNPEKDIAGYSIYRSEEKDKPLAGWELLTPALIDRSTYLDDRVVSGKTYFYYITATDKYKNVSEPSEVVSETMP